MKKKLKPSSILYWDWKSCPDEEELRQALEPFGVHVRYAETGTDGYALVISDKPLSPKRATREFNKAMREEG